MLRAEPTLQTEESVLFNLQLLDRCLIQLVNDWLRKLQILLLPEFLDTIADDEALQIIVSASPQPTVTDVQVYQAAVPALQLNESRSPISALTTYQSTHFQSTVISTRRPAEEGNLLRLISDSLASVFAINDLPRGTGVTVSSRKKRKEKKEKKKGYFNSPRAGEKLRSAAVIASEH